MKNYQREYDEDEPRRKRYIQCTDRMCGADDCPRCRPGNFRGGVYIGDIEEAEAAEAEERESPNDQGEPQPPTTGVADRKNV